MTTLSAREFNRDVSAAKRAALEGPVVITDRGRASHVLLSAERYKELVANTSNWASRLHMEEDIEFEPPRMDFGLRNPEL
ncbi:type II toxin-antitoxin system Phd/YefM family antitoxin [Corynebacterium sp. 20_84]